MLEDGTSGAKPTTPSARALSLKTLTAIATAPALLYFCLGLAYQNVGFPNEDAFILFIYSESLARDGVIAFYEGGPYTEGATDFLWMVLIAGFVKIGINAAIAAQLLNTIGIFIASLVFLMQSARYPGLGFIFVLAAVALPLTVVAHAGYVGFSSPFYSATALLAFYLVAYAPPRVLWTVPLLGIFLSLLRPDGVILGVAFTLVGYVYARGQRRPYVQAAGAAAAIGVLYFFWRAQYFDQLLPLPLIVKSTVDGIPQGLRQTQVWFMGQVGYIVPAALMLAWSVLRGRFRIVLAALPVILLTAAIAGTEASQNVFLRFQAPASATAIFLALTLLAELMGAMKRSDPTGRLVRGTAAIAVAALVVFGAGTKDLMQWKNIVVGIPFRTYVDTFPIRLSQQLHPETKIALTEAGRFAYWTDNETIDLVGLNTAEFANSGASPDQIADFDPDLVFMHTGELVFPPCDKPTFCVHDGPEFANFLSNETLPSHSTVDNRVLRATLSGFEFLQENASKFEVVVAWFGDGYHHVYLIAKDGTVPLDMFTRLLRESFAYPRKWSFVDAYNRFRR